MAKYYGTVGFAITDEVKRGVYDEEIVEHSYTGDVYRSHRSLNIGDQINGEIGFSKEISILADPFAYSNYASIRYITYLGVKWTVSSVDVQFPRLVLTIGERYNEN